MNHICSDFKEATERELARQSTCCCWLGYYLYEQQGMQLYRIHFMNMNTYYTVNKDKFYLLAFPTSRTEPYFMQNCMEKKLHDRHYNSLLVCRNAIKLI